VCSISGEVFDSNAITPATEFMTEVAKQLRVQMNDAITHNPYYQGLAVSVFHRPHLHLHIICSSARTALVPVWSPQVILSDSSVPGEGEHKLIDFMRRSRQHRPAGTREPRHCLYGSDADLVLLALATRERNVLIIREVCVQRALSRFPRASDVRSAVDALR
jgi:5'-3' exoribonuclease 2